MISHKRSTCQRAQFKYADVVGRTGMNSIRHRMNSGQVLIKIQKNCMMRDIEF